MMSSDEFEGCSSIVVILIIFGVLFYGTGTIIHYDIYVAPNKKTFLQHFGNLAAEPYSTITEEHVKRFHADAVAQCEQASRSFRAEVDKGRTLTELQKNMQLKCGYVAEGLEAARYFGYLK